MSTLLPLAQAFGPITAEQQRRMDEAAARLNERCAAAAYDPVMEKRQPIPMRRVFVALNPDGSSVEEEQPTGEVNCARCTHFGDFNAEHERGFCLWRRRMVSTWHPAKCNAFAIAA